MTDRLTSPAGAATRASYGVDAPGVMAGLLAAGAGGVAAGLAIARLACAEIARVLRPGGWVAAGDYLPAGLHADAVRAAGLVVEERRAASSTALSLMWIVVARKPRPPAGPRALAPPGARS